MAPRKKCPLRSSTLSIGNCQVMVEAKNFTSDSDQNSVQITLSKTDKIKISVVEGTKEHEDEFQCNGSKHCGDYYFILANPKDLDSQTKFFLKEVLALYIKELPAMNYAANTGKESMFLERCVTNGKYCTLFIKSKDDNQPGEVIAAITYQIIQADTQYAEIPLAAVSSIFQHKGIGRLLYTELRERLQSVGIRTLLCWGDKESEGFWLKQGFTVIGEVNKKGRARRLPIKADVRRALCFPGGSTLMVSHIFKNSPSKSLKFPLPIKPPELRLAECQELGKEVNQITGSGYSESEKLGIENFSVDGCQDNGPLPVAKYCSMANASGVMEGGSENDLENCSCSAQGTKKRIWEASCTSLKSKKVKGAHLNDCQLVSHRKVCTNNSFDRNCKTSSGYKLLSDASLANSGSNGPCEENEKRKAGNFTNDDDDGPVVPSTGECIKIMLMNIADNDKRSSLTKIIEDLGGVVTLDGSESTHVVTGKVRKTFNLCTALCSGSWVISPAWLKESFRKGRFVDEMPFILKDEDYKRKYRCELKCAVLRAKAHPNTLLKGLDIWPATHVQPPVSTLSAIVKSAGGNVIRTVTETKDVSKIIFISGEEDMEEALAAVKMGILTFHIDWLMNCIMRQELDLGAPKFAESL